MESTGLKMTTTQWLICIIASIGFAFDIYELLMLPLVVGPALQELMGAAPGSPEFQMWTSRLFYWPAICGGLFGLVGGYLTDRLGRRRVLTWSIMVYALGAFFAGFSTSVWMLLVFRCFVFVGVCVEFVAAVAWLSELFPDPKQREKVLGYTQAFSSFGGLLIAFANGLCVQYASQMPSIDLFGYFGSAIKDHHAAWRYTLMTGLIPAFPLLVIRPFLPESPAWQQKRQSGTLKRPSLAELFQPHLRRTGDEGSQTSILPPTGSRPAPSRPDSIAAPVSAQEQDGGSHSICVEPVACASSDHRPRGGRVDKQPHREQNQADSNRKKELDVLRIRRGGSAQCGDLHSNRQLPNPRHRAV